MPSIYEKKKSIYDGLEIPRVDAPTIADPQDLPQDFGLPTPTPPERISRPQFRTTPRDIRPPETGLWKDIGAVAEAAKKDIGVVAEAAKEMVAPTTEYTQREVQQASMELGDRAKWWMTYVASLGGRVGPKGLREELLKESEEFAGFGPALTKVAGDTGTLAVEWGWLYPKLFKLAGVAGQTVAKIPRVAKGMKALKAMGGIQKLATKHPHLYSAGTKALAAFAKGEFAGQTLAAIESFGKDKSAQEWIIDMNKRGALMGGVATAFSLAHSYDQYNYINQTRRHLRFLAYNRYVGRVNKGMLPKHSAHMGEAEARKIDDIIYALEQQMLGAPQELYGGKKPELSPQQAAELFAKHGYIPGVTTKSARRLSQIRRPGSKPDIFEEVKLLKAAGKGRVISSPVNSYREAYNPQTGRRYVIPEGMKVTLPGGYEISDPIALKPSHIVELAPVRTPEEMDVFREEVAQKLSDMEQQEAIDQEIAAMDAELAEIQRPAERPPEVPPKPSEIAPPAVAKEPAPPTEAEAVPTAPPIGEVKAPKEAEEPLSWTLGLDGYENRLRHIRLEEGDSETGLKALWALKNSKNEYRKILQRALKANEIVPREVLEEYKSEKWAQEALAKPPVERKPAEPTIIRAAAYYNPNTGEISEGPTHPQAAAKMKEFYPTIKEGKPPPKGMVEGFVTESGRFVTNKEAEAIAKKSGQIKEDYKLTQEERILGRPTAQNILAKPTPAEPTIVEGELTKRAFDEYWAGDDTKPTELEDAVLEYLADTNEEFKALEDKLMVIEETDPTGKTAEHKKVMAQLDKMRSDLEQKIQVAEKPAEPEVKVWAIINSRGQQLGKKTFATREEAQRNLEKRITSPIARTQFSVQPITPAEPRVEAAEMEDWEKEDYYGKKLNQLAKDPRNITKEEWGKPELEKIYNEATDAGVWDGAKAVAEKLAREEGKIAPAGPGEKKIKTPEFKPRGVAEKLAEPEVSDEEASGITNRRRKRLIKETEARVAESDIYQAELEGIEIAPIGPGFYYVPAKFRAEVEDIIGKPRKGGKNRLQRMFTFDPHAKIIVKTPEGKAEIGPTNWASAVQEALGRGKEGVDETWGEMDISEFAQQVKDAVEGEERTGGLSARALEAAEASGDPHIQYLVTKREMLKAGYSAQEVDDMTREWAEQYGLDEAEIENEFIGPEPRKLKEIKALPEDKQDAALEALARENVLKQERQEAKNAVNEVLKANDLEVEVEEVAEIEPEKIQRDLLGRPAGVPLTTGKTKELGIEPGEIIEKAIPIRYELSKAVTDHLNQPLATTDPDVILTKLMEQKGWQELFNNPANPMPEVKTALKEGLEGLELPFERRGEPVGVAIITPASREIVQLAYGADSWTGYHEGYHILRSHLTPKDRKVLDMRFKGDTEAEAREFAEFVKTGKVKTGYLRGIWRKLVEKLRKIKSALQGRGYRTAEDIFGEIRAGKIIKQNVTADGKSVEYEQRPMDVDVNLLSKPQLAKINTYMKRRGYDVRGVDDVLQILKNMTTREGKVKPLWHPTWIEAIKKAQEPPKKLSDTTKVLRRFGITNNPKEAGYITKNGVMIDFSGKREGGQPGIRSFDHRQIHEAKGVAGGTEGMISFMMAENNIRVGQRMIDMYNPLTAKQESSLVRYIDAYDGAIAVEINDKKFYQEYDEGTKSRQIIQDIRNYWAGRPTPSEVARFHRGEIRYETTGDRWIREANRKARINAEKARLKATIKPKARRGRLPIKIHDYTPVLSHELGQEPGSRAKPKPLTFKPKAQVEATPFLSDDLEPAKLPPAKRVELGERVATPKLTQEWFDKNVGKEPLRIIGRVGRGGKEILDEVSRYVWSSSSRLERIHPELMRRTREYCYRWMKRTAYMLEDVEPFLKKFNKLRRTNFNDWKALDLALKNSQAWKAEEIVAKHGMIDEYMEVKGLYSEIADMWDQVGGDLKRRADYWHREIKDSTGFLKHFYNTEHWSAIEQALKNRARRAGRDVADLTDEEKAQVINTLLRGYRTQAVTLSTPGAVKERLVPEVDKSIDRYYYDSGIALVRYIREMNQAISQREFFGRETHLINKLRAQQSRRLSRLIKLKKRQGLKPGTTEASYKEHISKTAENWKAGQERLERLRSRDLTQTIGGYVGKLKDRGLLSAEQERNTQRMIRGILQPRAMGRKTGLFTTGIYLDTLNSFFQALTQVDEYAYSIIISPSRAIPAGIRTIARRNPVTLRDIGVVAPGVEFEDKSLRKALSTMLTVTGFRGIDVFGKEALINTAFRKYRAEAQRKVLKPKFVNEMRRVFGKEYEDVIGDLKRGEITENVNYLLFNVAADRQPIAHSEMPEMYNTGGNARIFYTLKTFYLKRLNFVREQIWEDMKSPKTFHRGFGKLIWIVGAFTALGAGSDALKDFIKGRTFDFSDSAWNSILSFVMMSKYKVYKAKTEGYGRMAGEALVPPTKIVDEITKDIVTVASGKDRGFEIWRSVPFVGELYYWWFGRGKEKLRAKEGLGRPERPERPSR